MKVMVAAAGKDPDSRVAKRLGHAPWYHIVESRTGVTELVDNRAHEDGSHEMIARLVGDGVKVVITANIGPHAFRVIRALAGRVALARGTTVADALAKLERGDLRFLDEPTLARSVHEH